MAERLFQAAGDRVDSSAPGFLAEWQARREQLAAILNELADLAQGRDDPQQAERCSAGSVRLTEGRLTLAILGEFKRGKSTLINSLLGAEVMPVGVIPMTSVPLLVQHGDEPQLIVEFESGERRRIDLGELREYATESGNPGNHHRVRQVEVAHPAALLRSGVVLVDTPGIGSIHAHNTRVAYQLLARADAAIFALSIDSPASQAELDFLAAARAQVSHLIFALNKVDLLSAAELDQSSRFVQSALERVVPREGLRLHRISARLRDQGFRTLAAELEQFLAVERGRFLLRRAADVADAALREERRAVQLEQAALALSASESERRLAALQERLKEISRSEVEVVELLSGDIRRLVAGTLEPAIERFRRRGEASTRAAVEAELAAGRAGLRPRLERRLAAVVADEVAGFVPRLDVELEEGLAAVARGHAERANRLMAEVAKATAELFDVPPDRLSLAPSLKPSSGRLVLTEFEDLALGRISSALKGAVPGSLGRGLARRDALARGEELVDRHCGRIHHDALERLKEREQEWRRELKAALEESEAVARRAVAAAAAVRSTDARQQELAKVALDRRMERVRELETRIRATD